MSGFYIGVDGKARKIKGGYIGIDGKARKIKKGYIGVNGVARLCWTAVDPVFANNSWEDIIATCQTGSVPDTWNVGDKKTMNIGGTDYVIDIIGKNHDDYADGSGKAPLTFQFNALYASKVAMNDTAVNSKGWMSSNIRKNHLPTILAQMPTAVQTALKAVNKYTSKGMNSSEIIRTEDKLFILSEIEVYNTTSKSYAGEGTQYAYYAAGNKKEKRGGTYYENGWLRSPYKGDNGSYCYVHSSGILYSMNANSTNAYVAPAFCF